MSTKPRSPAVPPLSFFILSWALASALIAPLAHALPPEDDEPDAFAPRVERLDTAPHELWAAGPPVATPGARGPLWLAVQAGIAQLAGGERSYEAMLLAEIPLERFAPRAPRASALAPSIADAEGLAPRLKPPPRSSSREKEPPAGDGGASSGAAPSPAPGEAPPFTPEPRAAPLPLPARITPAIARAAVRAALRRARLADPEAPADALASRARAAALLPELRLRVSRLVDDSQSLSPTQYDPTRTTATGGVSLWLEARATWRLDRVVFADEEVALERLRRERAEAQAKLTASALGLLFAWQRAVAREADPGRTPEEHLAAALEVLEAEASLDLVTDGWFTRWRASRPTASPPGDEGG